MLLKAKFLTDILNVFSSVQSLKCLVFSHDFFFCHAGGWIWNNYCVKNNKIFCCDYKFVVFFSGKYLFFEFVKLYLCPIFFRNMVLDYCNLCLVNMGSGNRRPFLGASFLRAWKLNVIVWKIDKIGCCIRDFPRRSYWVRLCLLLQTIKWRLRMCPLIHLPRLREPMFQSPEELRSWPDP